jgi:hypothetical protein
MACVPSTKRHGRSFKPVATEVNIGVGVQLITNQSLTIFPPKKLTQI